MNLQTIDKFHQTRLGYLVFGLVELGLALLLADWALDSGDLWQWVLAVIFLVGFLRNVVRMLVRQKK